MVGLFVVGCLTNAASDFGPLLKESKVATNFVIKETNRQIDFNFINLSITSFKFFLFFAFFNSLNSKNFQRDLQIHAEGTATAEHS